MKLHADLIVHGGPIATLNPAQPWVEAMAISAGKILVTADIDTICDGYRAPETHMFDLQEKTVMPGLHDAHNHHQIAGKASLMEVEFLPTATLEEIAEAVQNYASTLPHDAWIVGGSWGSTLLEVLSERRAKDLLDKASGGRPVLLVDDSHHNKWANSEALRLSGIDASSPDPTDGSIMR